MTYMTSEPLFNPHLHTWRNAVPSPDAGKGSIEKPGQGENLRWQNRSSVPGEYENLLADAIEAAYLQGARSAEAMAGFLNERPLKSQGGSTWTPESLEAEMRRLGF
ncbi:MAG: recombinase-like helix-turn-helix domain-containing protein [Pseudomonadota bacterium]